MRKLNKRTDIMDNSVEAYACACTASCNCGGMCTCVCPSDPAGVGNLGNGTSGGIQSSVYTQVYNASKSGATK